MIHNLTSKFVAEFSVFSGHRIIICVKLGKSVIRKFRRGSLV